MHRYNFVERTSVLQDNALKIITDFCHSTQKDNDAFLQQLYENTKAAINSKELILTRNPPSTSCNHAANEDAEKENRVEGPSRRSSRKASHEATRNIASILYPASARQVRRPLMQSNTGEGPSERGSSAKVELPSAEEAFPVLQCPQLQRITRSQRSSSVLATATQNAKPQTAKCTANCKQNLAAKTAGVEDIVEVPASTLEDINPHLQSAPGAGIAVNLEEVPEPCGKGVRSRTKVICKGRKNANWVLPIVENASEIPTASTNPKPFEEVRGAGNSNFIPNALPKPGQEVIVETEEAKIFAEADVIEHVEDLPRRKSRKSLRESLQSLQRTSGSLTQIVANKSVRRAKRISLAKAKIKSADQEQQRLVEESLESVSNMGSIVTPEQPSQLSKVISKQIIAEQLPSNVNASKKFLLSSKVILKQIATEQLPSKASSSKKLPSATKYTPRSRANSSTAIASFLSNDSSQTHMVTRSAGRANNEDMRRLFKKTEEAVCAKKRILRARADKRKRIAEEKAQRVQAARLAKEQRENEIIQSKLASKAEKCASSGQKLKEKRDKKILKCKQLAEAKRLEVERRRREAEERRARVKEMELRQNQLKVEREKYRKAMSNFIKSNTNATVTLAANKTSDNYDITPRGEKYENHNTSYDYGIGDLSSGDSTDNEEMPRKKIPEWALGAQLQQSIKEQSVHQPRFDEVFPPRELLRILRLEEMFKNGKRIRRAKRTSSAIWDTPPSYKSLLQSTESL